MTDTNAAAPAASDSISVSQFASLLTSAPAQEAEHEEAAEQEQEEAAAETVKEEGAEQEAETSEEEQAEEETEEEAPEKEEEAAPQTITLKMPDGEVLNLTHEEAVKGILRQADYTKKTQEIAETQKQHQGIVEQYEARMTQTLQALEAKLHSNAQEADLTPEQWAHLKQNDPEAYLIKRQDAQDKYNEFLAVKQENARRQHISQLEARKKALASRQEQENLLAKRIPEWSDPQKKDELQTRIDGYLNEIGWTSEEIESVSSARELEAIYKAMKWDALQKSKPLVTKKVAAAPRVARPGAGAEKGDAERSALQAASKGFRKSGKVSDFASVIKAHNLV